MLLVLAFTQERAEDLHRLNTGLQLKTNRRRSPMGSAAGKTGSEAGAFTSPTAAAC